MACFSVEDDVISITNGHFSWASNDAPTLKKYEHVTYARVWSLVARVSGGVGRNGIHYALYTVCICALRM